MRLARLERGVPAALLGALLGFILRGNAYAQSSPAPACVITGRVAAGPVPLPGVSLIVSSDEAAEVAVASSSIDGTYRITIPGPGNYRMRANLAGFGDAALNLSVASDPCRAAVEVAMSLKSRIPNAAPSPTPTPSRSPSVVPARGPRGPGGPPGAGQRRFQDVNVQTDAAADTMTNGGAANIDPEAPLLLPTGVGADAATESISASGGNQVQTVDSLLFGDRLQMLDETGGDLDALGRRLAQGGLDGGVGPGAFGGGAGGFGGGPGGRGPGGGGFGGGFGGPGGPGRGGNRLQGNVNYNMSGSPFDAKPFALNGRPSPKEEYFQHRYGATLGGPLRIPGVFDDKARTSFTLSYAGTYTRNPFDAYSTVPTLAERSGNLSALGITVIDPLTEKPFPGGVIPSDRIDPSALALLSYIPLPNEPGATQNYRNVTTTTSHSNEFSLRLNHVFGAVEPPGRTGRPGQGGQGRGVRPAGRGPGGGAAVRRPPTLSINFTYRNSARTDASALPTLSGSTRTSGFDVPVSMSFSTGQIFHQARFGFNRNQSDSRNQYAYTKDVAGGAGILGVSTDPFDYGVPSLSFTTISSVRDRNPSSRVDQRFSFGDTLTRTYKSHTFRVGAEARITSLESRTDANARGNFIFTGYATTAFIGATRVPGTGLDFADFLLGRPQQGAVQFGPGLVQFHSHSENLFLQDDWRIRRNLTLNLGLRYEYVSPFQEAHDRLVNLDVTPDFTAAAPVLAGQTGAYTGPFPEGGLYADTNNVAPRVGAAWRPKSNLTVRGGFGINYNLGAYGAIAQKLAAQPPFAQSQTNLSSPTAPLTLANAFANPTGGAVTTNSYGIDKNYKLPAVLIWNLDVQRELKDGLLLAASYTGTRGFDLDLLRAPNRGPSGLRIQGVAPFNWQSSEATSIMHSITVRARKRLTHGVGGGFTYTLARSTDNASSIGGGATVVAQDDANLEAERGRSSFDRRHRFAGDFLVELPFGPGRKWLHDGVASSLLGGWVWSGTINIQSGAPFTARVLGDLADVSRGVNGTLRADVTGETLALANPTTKQWFNTGAFVVPPQGAFGDAPRNSITGPGAFLVNMGLIKNFSLGRPRVLSFRVQAANVFNTPQFTGIDTVVNSPTYGQVVQVGSMRTVQFQTRLRF